MSKELERRCRKCVSALIRLSSGRESTGMVYMTLHEETISLTTSEKYPAWSTRVLHGTLECSRQRAQLWTNTQQVPLSPAPQVRGGLAVAPLCPRRTLMPAEVHG